MGDRTTCTLQVAGLISREEFNEILEVLEGEDISRKSAEKTLCSSSEMEFEEVNYAQAPDDLLEQLEAACVSYCWDWSPGDAYGAGRIVYDGQSGKRSEQKCYEGEVVLTLSEMEKPEEVEKARLAEDLPGKLFGLAVYNSQHELVELLSRRAELQPWHKARQERVKTED